MVAMTVLSFFLSLLIIATIFSAVKVSILVVGSSKKSNEGLVISYTAIERRFFSPLLKVLVFRFTPPK